MATSPGPFQARAVTGRVADLRQLARVEKYTTSGGGLRARLITAGGFDVEVLLERGMDLGTVTWQGIPLGFCTPALWQAPPPGGSSEGFGRRFGAGMLTTCGLDQFGSPNLDAGQHLPQHGRATELPAGEVSTAARWTVNGYEIEITGQLRQWRLFGEDLGWHRRISALLGSNVLLVEDTVINQGTKRWPHMMLYHFNIGYPLLDAGTTVEVIGSNTPPAARDEAATSGMATWDVFPEPATEYPEQVFRHDLDPAGPGELRIHNAQLGIAVTVAVDPTVLPWAFQWKSAVAGTYAMGIEPANCPTVDGRAAARALGRLPELEPGESQSYQVRMSVDAA